VFIPPSVSGGTAKVETFSAFPKNYFLFNFLEKKAPFSTFHAPKGIQPPCGASTKVEN